MKFLRVSPLGLILLKKHFAINLHYGFDGQGKIYKDIYDFERQEVHDKKLWYLNAIQFWQTQDQTIDGVLGGFGQLHHLDINHSKIIVQQLFSGQKNKIRKALDVGAGIGRISQNVLQQSKFEVIALQPNPKYHKILANKNIKVIGSAIQQVNGLQKFDLIWIQWCIGHVLDSELIQFLKICKRSIGENGFIVVKQNVTQKGFYFDRTDKSLTRSEYLIQQLFKRAGLQTLKKSKLQGAPKQMDIFDIVAWQLN